LVLLEQFAVNDNRLLFTLSQKGLQIVMNDKAELIERSHRNYDGELETSSALWFLR
jgi:hypothetical protein